MWLLRTTACVLAGGYDAVEDAFKVSMGKPLGGYRLCLCTHVHNASKHMNGIPFARHTYQVTEAHSQQHFVRHVLVCV
jgi:hypothetical protein